MSLLSRPRGDLFQLIFPPDFIPENIRRIWQPYIERMPTVIEDVDSFIAESVQTVSLPPVNYEPVEQQSYEKTSHTSYTKKHKSPIHSQDLPDKSISVTFRMTDGYANYFILKQSLVWRFDHEQRPPYLPWIKVLAFDVEGNIMTQEQYVDVNFHGLDEYSLSYSDVQQNFQTFNAAFSFSRSEFKYPGEL